MTFKLRAQLDGDDLLAFALYNKYVESNRRRFPESALALMEHPDWWRGGTYSRCPLNGELTTLKVDRNKPYSRLELLISKPDGDVEIEIVYSDVLSFDLPHPTFYTWSYDQFKYYDPFHDHKIRNTKMFQHEIEWLGGPIWTIRAREIAVVWRDI